MPLTNKQKETRRRDDKELRRLVRDWIERHPNAKPEHVRHAARQLQAIFQFTFWGTVDNLPDDVQIQHVINTT